MRRSKIGPNPFDQSPLRRRRLHIQSLHNRERNEPEKSTITIINFTPNESKIIHAEKVEECFPFLHSETNTWINIEGLKEKELDKIGQHFGIHPLIVEDILSTAQRAKMDDLNHLIFSLLHVLYFNEKSMSVESKQLSIILGRNFIITFQDESLKDVFQPLREKINTPGSKLRLNSIDYLFYALVDEAVDNYFLVMEKLGEKMELLEDDITHRPGTKTLAKINYLRKEMMFLRRTISPVRELVNGVLRSESVLIDEKIEKYFKDIYDHIVQANELAENYRDMMINLQDLYLSNVNLKMNEVMKVMAVVTCLLAPATVIGGIFGMNFNIIPWTQTPGGFYIAVGLMLLVPIWMIWMFRRRGWF